MNLKWITTYMVLVHGLSYNEISTILHFMILNDKYIFNYLFGFVVGLLEKNSWFSAGTQAQLMGFKNSAVAKYFKTHGIGIALNRYESKIIQCGATLHMFYFYHADLYLVLHVRTTEVTITNVQDGSAISIAQLFDTIKNTIV